MPLPLQQNMNMEEPGEMFKWMLVSIPGVDGAPVIMHPDVLEKISRHLWQCGARFVPEEQQIKYLPPTVDTHWMAAGAGKWVDVRADVPAEVSAPTVNELSHAEKLAIVKQLADEGYLRGDEIAGFALGDAAEVVNDG